MSPKDKHKSICPLHCEMSKHIM